MKKTSPKPGGGKVTRKTANPTKVAGPMVSMAGSKSTKTANNTVNRRSGLLAPKKK